MNRENSEQKNMKIKRIVYVGIQFDRIGEIDTVNENFQAEVCIEAKWRENTIITKYDPEVYWNPRLFIENSLQETKDQTRYSVEHDIVTNTSTITQRRTVRGIFWERMELENFPIDTQQLSIILMSIHNSDEIKLVENENKKYFNMRIFKTFIDQQKWKLYKFIDISEHTSYDDSTLNLDYSNDEKVCDAPKLCASCYASRKPGYYFWNAYFLIFLNTVVSLNTFAIDAPSRMIPTFTLLLTSITFKWVVNRSLPAVGYLTSLDKYEIASIFYLCLVSIWHAFACSMWESKELKKFEIWVALTFALLFVALQAIKIAWLLFIFKKLRRYREKEDEFYKKQRDFLVRRSSNIFMSLSGY